VKGRVYMGQNCLIRGKMRENPGGKITGGAESTCRGNSVVSLTLKP